MTPKLTPDWFDHNLTTAPNHHALKVLGASIHYQTWSSSENDSPGLLFVHGHAAHAHWWDFVAPEFCQQYQVGALDMSGNGDSGHREQYRPSQFAAEIVAVANALGPRTIVVAHSFGGSMARIAAHLHPEEFKALILVDSVISPTRRAPLTPQPVNAPRQRSYPGLKEAQRRFRLRPPQPRPADYIIDHLSKHSVRQSQQGYQFKLDPQVFDKLWPDEYEYPDAASMMQGLKIPAAYIYGELSRFCPPEALELLKTLFPPERLKMVAAAHHHVFLDQPLRFNEVLKEVLANLSLDESFVG
ncbi:MAG: pimeloyl-ACP methyl ester carboxylesterase [Patiriisocius sp.]|jgi:pimeloyl-ACP methyl ester carboxylesterase